MTLDQSQSTYKWYMLALAATTHTLVAAAPFSCLPALFNEISEDLGLSLVQIGFVWGMVGLGGLFTTLPGGLLGDRFGVRPVLTAACLLAGATGAARGLSGGFASLAATAFLFGLVRSLIPVNVHKTVNIWFQGRNLGMANGVVSMGMGVGLALGPMVSATLLSPLLGGWRQVLFLYGAVSVVVGILWSVMGRGPRHHAPTGGPSIGVPLGHSLSRLVGIRDLWPLGLGLMFRMGCMIGVTGYLPLYLRGRGWTPAGADAALAVFFAASTVAVMPLSLLSDRIGSRRAVLFPALLSAVLGLGLLPAFDGAMVWLLIVLVGIFADGFMAVLLTMTQETKDVGPRYSGTALGLVLTAGQLGAFLSPPLGNSLAGVSPGLPLVFWAGLSAIALAILAFSKETGWRGAKAGRTLPPEALPNRRREC